jgi:hypothetical protein
MGEHLDRDQDYTTTLTETELNIDKIKKENDELKKFMKEKNINLDDIDSIFIGIDSESESQENKKTQYKKDKNNIINKEFRQYIIENYIKKNLEGDIEEATTSRVKWAQTATAMFCISEILMIIQTALSFTSATYQIILISYLAGVVGVIAIGLTRFGAYARTQSNEKNILYNKLLKKIGINDSMPNLLDINDKSNKK